MLWVTYGYAIIIIRIMPYSRSVYIGDTADLWRAPFWRFETIYYNDINYYTNIICTGRQRNYIIYATTDAATIKVSPYYYVLETFTGKVSYDNTTH